MEKTFFDAEFLKSRTRSILCPSCEKEFNIELDQTEAVCEECGENFAIEFATEDFVWHPSQEY